MASPISIVTGQPVLGYPEGSFVSGQSFTMRSFIIDIASNHGSTDIVGIRSIEFFDEFGTLLTFSRLTPDFTAFAGNNISYAKFAFDTSLSKTGTATNVSWYTTSGGASVGQRVSCVFTGNVTFSSIKINNYHTSGASTNRGAKDVKIYITERAILSIERTIYNYNTGLSDLIYDGVLAQHIASNIADDELLILQGGYPPAPVSILLGAPVFESPLAYIQPFFPVESFITGEPVAGIPSGYLIASPVGFITGEPAFESPVGEYLFVITDNSKLVYIFTLTGNPDIEIPITSFQGRLRSGKETYLSVVISTIEYATEISNRSSGKMVIEAFYMVDGIRRKGVEIARVNISAVRIDEGSSGKSITLTGYKQETYTQKTVALTEPVYKLVNDGKITYRFAKPDMTLKPGDSVNIGYDSFTADVISYFVGSSICQMEVSEA